MPRHSLLPQWIVLLLILGPVITVLPVTAPAESQLTEWMVFTKENSGLPDNNVLSLAMDAAGILWIGTKYEGLVGFDGAHWINYKPGVGSLSGTATGNFFVAEDLRNGLLKMRISPNKAMCLAGKSTQSSQGLRIRNREVAFGPQAEAFYDLAIDSKGNKWVGTKIAGVFKFDGTSWVRYNKSNSGLPDDYAWSVLIDANDDIWVGTKYGGMAFFDGSVWAVYDTSNSGLPSDDVCSLAMDASGNKWIGTTKGLAMFDGANWTVFQARSSGLPANHVECVAVDSKGDKWIGTWGGGLARFDGAHWTAYTTANSGLPDDYIWSLAIDNSGTKWIGTYSGGLAEFDGASWRVYNEHNTVLPHNMIYDIVIDSNGNKWIATILGLAVYRAGGVLLPSIPHSPLSGPFAFSLAQNYPNPFNISTQISFTLHRKSRVKIAVHDVSGKLVRELTDMEYATGEHHLQWDGTDAEGVHLSSGVYVCSLESGAVRLSRRMVLLR